jgi:predicted nucleotide-binding protein (sugar kinase/HSP70/actin superfamily)
MQQVSLRSIEWFSEQFISQNGALRQTIFGLNKCLNIYNVFGLYNEIFEANKQTN